MYNNGVGLLKSGKISNAKEMFDSILEKYPQSPYAYYGLAYYYYKEGLIYEAINANTKVQKEHASFLPALLLNSKLALEIKRPGIALFDISVYAHKGGDINNSFDMEIETYLFGGKVDKVKQVLDSAAETTAENPLFLTVQAKYYLHTGEFTRGMETCSQAAEIADGDAEILKRIGDFYKDLGFSDSAASYYEQALSSEPDDYYLKADVAEGLIEMNYTHQARKLLDEMAETGEKWHRYHLLSARLLLKKGLKRQALMEYGMIIPKMSQIPTALSVFADFYLELKDKRFAQQYSDLSTELADIEDYPDVARVSLITKQVELFTQLNQPYLSIQLCEAIMDSASSDFRTLYNVSILYQYTQNMESLKASLDRLKAATTGIPDYQAKAGLLYLTLDSLTASEELIKEALEIDKTNKTGILAAVDIHRKRRSLSGAVDFLNTYDEFLSYSPEIYKVKLSLYEELKEYTSAIQFTRTLVDIATEDLDRYKDLIRLEETGGDPDKVLSIYERCLENNPDNPDAYVMFGQYYLDKGDFSKAREMTLKAVELDSLHAAGIILQADIFAQEGNVDDAIVMYEKAVKIDQYQGYALGSMAVLLLEKDVNPMVVLNHARKAGMFDATNPVHFCTQGRAFYKAGKYQLAVSPFKQAVAMAPDDPKINYYAGLNLSKLNKNSEARTLLNNALKYGLKGDLKKEAEKVLGNL
jgi:tetratricopeptide (TPR) repeat protein